MITDLKNNKGKLNPKKKGGAAAGSATDIQFDRLKRFIGNFTTRRNQFDREALRVTLDDIRNIDTKGKWWLVGAAWAGRDGQGGIGHNPNSSTGAAASSEIQQASEEAVKGIVDSAGVDLLKLAKQQGMNTDVRRSIFIVLLSSEDCVDAHYRLQRLNLKDKQEREIIRVLIHCCGAERVYNPYYALVAARFCGDVSSNGKSGGHGFKITFQYGLWDFVKELEEARGAEREEDPEMIRKVRNLARFYAWLVAGGYLWLTVIKVW
jgi:nucleolar MIF4G domain-containing protein 1